MTKGEEKENSSLCRSRGATVCIYYTWISRTITFCKSLIRRTQVSLTCFSFMYLNASPCVQSGRERRNKRSRIREIEEKKEKEEEEKKEEEKTSNERTQLPSTVCQTLTGDVPVEPNQVVLSVFLIRSPLMRCVLLRPSYSCGIHKQSGGGYGCVLFASGVLDSLPKLQLLCCQHAGRGRADVG